jgi:hypothetical protein
MSDGGRFSASVVISWKRGETSEAAAATVVVGHEIVEAWIELVLFATLRGSKKKCGFWIGVLFTEAAEA